MPVEFVQKTEDHGIMNWAGQFDEDGRAIFACALCGASIAMAPSRVCEKNYRRIEFGNIHASHTTYITLNVVEAALSREIWPQPQGIHEKLEQWAEVGGGPPIRIDGLNVSPPSNSLEEAT